MSTPLTKAVQTTKLTSLVLRILWSGWMLGKGRAPKPDEVRLNKGAMIAMAKNFLPELKRLQTKEQK